MMPLPPAAAWAACRCSGGWTWPPLRAGRICLIVLPIFAPIVAKLDFGTVIQGKQIILCWFAILMAVNMQTAFLTPPFGFALFYMKGTVPPSVTMVHIYKGIVPFVIVQLLALVLCIVFPDIVLVLPRHFGFLE
jgi:TRAP-type mannitol/chloroaromatic compound transport system permease large subunit